MILTAIGEIVFVGAIIWGFGGWLIYTFFGKIVLFCLMVFTGLCIIPFGMCSIGAFSENESSDYYSSTGQMRPKTAFLIFISSAITCFICFSKLFL